jgi:uncharacterized protein (DUF362 family)
VSKRFFLLIISSLLTLSLPAAENIFSRELNPRGARIVIANDPKATVAFQAQPENVRTLVNRGLLQLAGKTNIAIAWKTFVSTNDVVGIKVYSAPGANSGTRPDVVAAVIEGLISAGVRTNKIIIWDKELTDLRLADYADLAKRYRVKVAASTSAGHDEKTFYESPLIGNLVWGDVEFKKKGPTIGRKSFVTKLAAKEITKIISIVPLLNHNLAGTTGHLCSLALGSVDNTQRFEQPERLATALPEIYALPSLSDKVVLNITDALICQYQGEQRSLLHYSAALNEIWFSKDPVALDVLAIQELNRQRETANVPTNKLSMEIYENAALLELGVNDLKNIRIERTP